jgi:two-component system, sensor histidine kinase and response regulator
MKDEGEKKKEENGEAGSDSSPSPHPSSLPLHILVAEDDEFSAKLIEHLLARRGNTVRLASNGREALALAEEGAFDLLILDVQMPELDGFQVVQSLRERERSTGGHLPVIALTAHSRNEDRERCLAAGMDDFLTKPVPAVDLLATIQRTLRKSESGRMKDANEKKSVSDSSSVLHPSSAHSRLLDPIAVLRACGNDAQGLHRMCQDLVTYLPGRLREAEDALTAGDAQRLRQVAHKLSALLAAFSTVAGSAASDLEDLAAQGQVEAARPLVRQIESMVRELLQFAPGLSLERLRSQIKPENNANRTAHP